MHISALIRQLEGLKMAYGDLPVIVNTSDGGRNYVDRAVLDSFIEDYDPEKGVIFIKAE